MHINIIFFRIAWYLIFVFLRINLWLINISNLDILNVFI